MRKRLGIMVLLLVLAGTPVWSAADADDAFEKRLQDISRAEMQAVVEFLGHDLLEGRAPGTRGGDLAEIYVQSLFKFMNLEPAGTKGYMQPFTLQKFTTSNIQLSCGKITLKYIHDLVGTCTRDGERFELNAPLVFAGFGIRATQWDWDDFKDADVSGKILVCRVNDPGLYHPDIFEGKTLTYYGRWTYHIEEAVRRGARGILLIHTDESAGYDWNVVKNSWTNGELFIPSQIENDLVFRGWIREKSLRTLLATKGIELDTLYKDSLSRNFRPTDLDLPVRISGNNKCETIMNRNVVAGIPGRVRQRIVLSAHIDHLGKSDAGGDNIFNGAIDNGTAVAAMLVAAKILKEFQSTLHYSVTVLACNSEEAGLLGAKYYVDNTDRSTIVANINFESSPVWKTSTTLMGIGARFSTFEDWIREIAAAGGLGYSQFSLANQGLFYRSDQFAFARRGIPAVWISAGEEEVDGGRHYTRFWLGDYHTVRDEYHPNWDLGGLRQTIQAALRLVRRINDLRTPPTWKNNRTFPMESEKLKVKSRVSGRSPESWRERRTQSKVESLKLKANTFCYCLTSFLSYFSTLQLVRAIGERVTGNRESSRNVINFPVFSGCKKHFAVFRPVPGLRGCIVFVLKTLDNDASGGRHEKCNGRSSGVAGTEPGCKHFSQWRSHSGSPDA